MKRARTFSFVIAALSALTLSACGQSDATPSASPAASDHVYSIPAQFTQGDGNAHLQEAEAAVETVRIHYHRFDDNFGDYQAYANWSLWVWDSGNSLNGEITQFDKYDDYGVYVDVARSKFNSDMRVLGFIVCCYENGHWYGKDPDGDRLFNFEGTAPGGVKDIYLISGSANVYDDPNNALKPSLQAARLSDSSRATIRVLFNLPEGAKVTFDPSKLSVTVNGEKQSGLKVGDYANKAVEVTLPQKIELSDVVVVYYQFDETWIDSKTMVITRYFDSEEFIADYVYNGHDLGASFDNEANPTKTTFKVWAPTSSKVVLNLYATGDYRTDATPSATHEMEKGAKGVFTYTVNENLDGTYYTYTVTNSKGTNEVVDPYARSAGLNGRRGMVVNFARLNAEIDGWADDERPEIANLSASSIYEIHVRDMTINPNSGVDEARRGKYLGLAQSGTYFEDSGTRYKTGLDHIEDLGVTHVQIQPFYDYSSVDESTSGNQMSDTNYNWGYDPQNYNALEGSYSSNPADGNVRIKEFKQMVMAFHQKGININMDVVYNHTAASENSSFNYLVPCYYYRTSSAGVFYNGSGCGNEVASNRAMMHDFIVDSVRFWADEYHLSGFRFDLMGLEDNQTMIDVYEAAIEVDPNALVYGEPWDMGSLKTAYDADNLTGQKTLQHSLAQDYFYGQGNYVGAFNDVIRNAIRGGNGKGNKGYVQGVASSAKAIEAGSKGLFSLGDASLSPIQCINYASCHDNYTLYDQLIQSVPEDRVFNDVYSQANALVFFSQGIAFIQEGDDFLRSKYFLNPETQAYEYCENSYNVGDTANDMDYSLRAANDAMVELTKQMISLRASCPQFALGNRAAIDGGWAKAFNDSFADENGNIAYTLTANNQALRVIFSLDGLDVNGASGTLLFSNRDTENIGKPVASSLHLGANEVAVIAL